MALNPILDLYSDYLIANEGQATSIELSALLENQYSHDKITRALAKIELGSKELWQYVKPFVKKIMSSTGVLIIDDTVEEKPYMAENEMICWHFDHVSNRSVKGINQLTALYHNEDVSLPVGFDIVKKDQLVLEAKTKKEKRKSSISKQEQFRSLISQSISNGLIFAYILADKWFSSVENYNFIHELNQFFIFPLKINRKVALSRENQLKGEYQSIGSLELEENQVLQVWLEEMEFPVTLTKQVFKNGLTEAVLYLCTNDLKADAKIIKTFYQKRWKVEEFYKSIKSNLGYANSPTHTIITQTNHLFLSMIAFVKMEKIRKETKKNHYQIKKLLTFNALQHAWKKLNLIKSTYKEVA